MKCFNFICINFTVNPFCSSLLENIQEQGGGGAHCASPTFLGVGLDRFSASLGNSKWVGKTDKVQPTVLDNLYNGGAGTLTTFTIWCCRHAKSEVFTSSDCQECLCLGAGQVPGFLHLRWPFFSYIFSFCTTANILLFLQMACSPKECPPCPLGQHHEVSSTCG